jgi:hypothetical protein
LQPHRSRYWLNPEPQDPVAYDAQVKQICEIYAQTPDLHAQGVHVLSTDEMTGIQALERIQPTLPMQQGRVEHQEFEYERHGTQSLIANFEVATGHIVSPSLGPTRTEQDFATHITHTVETDRAASWVFIVDHLNIHQSESLVRLVAERCVPGLALGIKGESGILESMATRAQFLQDAAHRIRFIYTPKHSSWLNQIEIWFSILVRRLLQRASFSSLQDMRQRILAFIAYFNQTMAKPYKWTYKGRPLSS